MTTADTWLTVGDRAPDIALSTLDGHRVAISSLWGERPLALVLLRPLDTDHCVDHALQLRDADENMREAGGLFVTVCDADPALASAFAERWNLPYPLLHDPTGNAYQAFTVSSEQPGSFIIDQEGVLRFVHRSKDALDNPSTWSLIGVICALTGRVVEQPEPSAVNGQPADWDPERAATPEPGVTLPNYVCGRCRYTECEVLDVSTSSGMMSRVLNLQHRRFSAVSCKRCMHTEFFKADSSALRNIFDLLLGS